jgi:hypothetical protein
MSDYNKRTINSKNRTHGLYSSRSPFDPDQHAGSAIGIAAALGWHDSGRHQHQRHQLLFAQAGCMTIELDDQVCLLPPTRAAWLPAGCPTGC